MDISMIEDLNKNIIEFFQTFVATLSDPQNIQLKLKFIDSVIGICETMKSMDSEIISKNPLIAMFMDKFVSHIDQLYDTRNAYVENNIELGNKLLDDFMLPMTTIAPIDPTTIDASQIKHDISTIVDVDNVQDLTIDETVNMLTHLQHSLKDISTPIEAYIKENFDNKHEDEIKHDDEHKEDHDDDDY